MTTPATPLTAEEIAEAAATKKARKVQWCLTGIAVALFVLAILFPYWNRATWQTGSGTVLGLLKSLELFLIIGIFGCIAGIGGIKITSSDKAHMEWYGSVLLGFGALMIGAFAMFRLVGIDEFASYRHLVTPRGARAVVEEPELTDMDWDTGIITFKVDETFQWVTVNVDYFDNDPMARKSKVFYHVPTDGKWNVPDFERASRVGVFYGTGNGPSGEVFDLNKVEIAKREAAAAEASLADADAATAKAVEDAVSGAVRAAEDKAAEEAAAAKLEAAEALKTAVEDALKAAASKPAAPTT